MKIKSIYMKIAILLIFKLKLISKKNPNKTFNDYSEIFSYLNTSGSSSFTV